MKPTTKLLLAAVLAAALATTASARTAWMGVYTQTVDDELAEAFDLKTDYGAIINEVIPESPADEAGLREDDIIIKFNGNRIWDSRELTDFVRDQSPGDEVTLTIIRDGREQELTLTLDRRRARDMTWGYSSPRAPGAPRVPSAPSVPGVPDVPHIYHFGGNPHGFVGVQLQNLNEQLGKYFGVENGDGVLITEVEEESPAEAAGLKAGDVIVAVDGELIDDASDVREIIADQREGEAVDIEIVRERQRQTLAVTVEDTNSYGYHQFQMPDLGDLQYYLPRMRGLHRGNSHHFPFDAEAREEWQREMEAFQKEMEELKRELKDLRFEFEQQ